MKNGKEHEKRKDGTEEAPFSDPVIIAVDGILDLHTFKPSEVKSLIPDYIEECRRLGITRIRIIHGKGTGVLRKTVHSILAHLPLVVSFVTAGIEEGGWGATIVTIKPKGID